MIESRATARKWNLNGLRAILAGERITQAEVALRLSLHYNTINAWLAGRNDPGISGIIDVLQAIGMNEEEIMSLRLGDLVRLEETENAPA